MFTKRNIKFPLNFASIVIAIIFSPLLLSLGNLALQKVINPEKKVKLSFKRNYIPKDQLLSLNKSIKESLFNTRLIPDRAISLNNGWYVVGDAFSNALSESKGLVVFNKDELKKLKEILFKRNLWLQKNNIKFYVSIAPNKLTVYDSLIPITKKKCRTKLEQLDSLCQSINVSFIDLGKDFKNHKHLRLYHKTDTHWNDLGAFVAYSTVINTFKKDFPNKKFKDFNINNLERYTTHNLQGDLMKMLKVDKKEEFIHLKLDTAYAKHTPEKRHKIPDKYRKKETKDFELRYINDKQNLKLLVFRDSFFGYCNPFFIENFNETLLIWDYVFDKKIILEEKPDIVLIEIVERDIDNLLL